MSETNKTVVRRLFEEVWNRAICRWQTSSLHKTTLTMILPRPIWARSSEKKRATLYRTAFPDVRLTIEDIISEGETVTARWSCQGTHKGDLSGIAQPESNSPSRISVALYERQDDRRLGQLGCLGMMQQLGIVAELGKAKAMSATTR
jgi:hypothetical protein